MLYVKWLLMLDVMLWVFFEVYEIVVDVLCDVLFDIGFEELMELVFGFGCQFVVQGWVCSSELVLMLLFVIVCQVVVDQELIVLVVDFVECRVVFWWEL